MANNEAVFRSAEMSLVQLYVSNEIARDVFATLGELGNVQFRDLNSKVSAFQRAFVSDVRRYENGLRQVRFLREQLKAQSIKELPAWEGVRSTNAAVTDILTHLDELEESVGDLRRNFDSLKVKEAHLLEYRHTLQAVENFLGNAHGSADQLDSVTVIAGVLPTSRASALERLLWRSMRGNLVVSTGSIGDMFDSKAKHMVPKSVFIVVTYGSELASKATKIAEALDATLFPADSSESNRTRRRIEVNSQLEDIKQVLRTTEAALQGDLDLAAESISSWARIVAQEKAIYEVLNLLSYDRNRKLLIGEGWVPTDEIPQVQLALRRVSTATNVESPCVLHILETNRTPPTYHRTNKVTGAFQSMIDVYAVASYQEVNPALPTVITFPFLFAVMFGDLGHGFILFLAAFYLVLNERKLAKVNAGDIFDMAYSGRYILMFMGIFAMFAGLMYNDVFSRSMTLFASGWEWPEHKAGETVSAVSTGVYKFGLDYAWHGTENNLLFTNSYKMKLSVLMGYLHMTYSHVFSLVNALYFNVGIDIWGNFVPSLVFFQSIFGYLSLCIVYKWSIDWVKIGKPAPSLLNMLINMFLAPGKIDEQLYKGQAGIQVFLVLIALVAVPWLLLLKPLYLKRQLDNKYTAVSSEESSVDIGSERHGGDDDDDEEGHEEHGFGDILIHQVIHTIEWCLNSVSHTASYLRLWALSLAHAQLSQVLWNMTLQSSFGMYGVVGIFMTVVLFAMWFTLTVAVLVVMEGTSAMLHALRLHWVESMSKFYIGEGHGFVPFSFKSISSTQ
ncbi:V-type proton ATPase subunit a, vacuolar isoform [Wickerhamiella sorbophila]|uniref:V-type proton ATPase subunit a n=1 Tax=Wickerhamiella sorbophila TaxID=45607 RepID=A0A2T0FP97_9ASCO|nr:V-type proton ATPase subunit a, vacuolar isoform [Wickerhamiella sorbophila]PRT56810.1 V-type proton ATPase subunit a, vacuolar isoform [Wickerhamiella sorbophila]